MSNMLYLILAFVLVGDHSYRQYIIDNIRPEYFMEACFREIFNSAKTMMENGKPIDILTIREAIIHDSDAEVLSKRIDSFRRYFVEHKILQAGCTDDEVTMRINILLSEIVCGVDYSISVESAVHSFLLEFVKAKKEALFEEFKERAQNNPTEELGDELANRLNGLDALLSREIWRNYLVDFSDNVEDTEIEPLFSRKGIGFFWRGNLYLVSGFSGSMKSYFCLSLAAAAQFQGTNADKTLSFYTSSVPLKVLYVDSELAENTIVKRRKAFKELIGGHLNLELFKYLSLLQVPGGIEDKMRVFNQACRCYHPDVIFIDSARDLCLDFNDHREADALIRHYKQIATDLNAVVISTSHKSLGGKNAKGHFGMRFNEAAGLEMSLEKVTDGLNTYIHVEYPKQREDDYEPFSFRFSPVNRWVEEYSPTVDRSEERRQLYKASESVRRVMPPGTPIRYSDLKRRLTEEIKVSETTAKNYISALTGTVLVKTAEGLYFLTDSDPALPLEDDIPEG